MMLPQLTAFDLEFQAHEFGTTKTLTEALGQSDEPIALMLTCWELGLAPDELSHASPGEVMVVQNPGGLVSSASMTNHGMDINSVLYGIHQHTVQHLIVCGHTQCNTLAALLTANTRGKLDAYRDSIANVLQRTQSRYSSLPASEWLKVIAQESVLQQLVNLRSHSAIRARIDDGSLSLHAWIRDDDTAAIAAFDPETGQFST